ncbi:MAG: hypothetical protein LBU88_00380 [Treponema sp.]|jgi:hypothetical protein|nr:hypothetical protein [Treponema sp.]
MKTRKSTAFWMSFLSLIAIYFITLWQNPDVLKSIAGGIIWGIVAAGGLYQGANVADNGVKGKFYRPELDEPKLEGK